ncbi:hypothetical protein [Variovorax sp. WS11]|uniref:hypothetical protein n=1 Tax=Variovorax sp. WS11 TaxID=1105204 RepID=UPI0013DB0774|nr:hypothetical protein [Variovorax sp. WS11]NDZ13591.1 hypothetical protein [Variovorax sp. WS11]
MFIDRFFFGGQQVRQQGGQASRVELLDHLAIAWAESTAPAAMRKQHNATRRRGQGQVGFEHGLAHRDPNRKLSARFLCGVQVRRPLR